MTPGTCNATAGREGNLYLHLSHRHQAASRVSCGVQVNVERLTQSIEKNNMASLIQVVGLDVLPHRPF
jgi:hypothetical protein